MSTENWVEQRRSVPPCERACVPSTHTQYACWARVDRQEGLTVYRPPDDNSREAWVVVREVFGGNDVGTTAEEHADKETALEAARAVIEPTTEDESSDAPPNHP